MNPDKWINQEINFRRGHLLFQVDYRHISGNVSGGPAVTKIIETLKLSVRKLNDDKKNLLPEEVFLVSLKVGGEFGEGHIGHMDSSGKTRINTPLAREKAQETLNKLKGFSFLRNFLAKMTS